MCCSVIFVFKKNQQQKIYSLDKLLKTGLELEKNCMLELSKSDPDKDHFMVHFNNI